MYNLKQNVPIKANLLQIFPSNSLVWERNKKSDNKDYRRS